MLVSGYQEIWGNLEVCACRCIDDMTKRDQRAHNYARKRPGHDGQRLRASAAAKLHVDVTADNRLARSPHRGDCADPILDLETEAASLK